MVDLAEYGEEIERVRSAMAAPLSRAERNQPGADPKWAAGDLLLSIPDEEVRLQVADKLGLSKADARSYWQTSYAWPTGDRVAAAWTAHRTLNKLPNRREVIRPGMTYRQAHYAATGRHVDRPAVHRVDDDRLIDELVEVLTSDRADTILPKLTERLKQSKEGRRTLRNRRTTKAVNALHHEIRQIEREIETFRKQKRPELRMAEDHKKLLQLETTIESMVMVFDNEREAIDDGEWKRLGARLQRLADRARRAADRILLPFDAIDVEVVEQIWTLGELSGGDDEEIVDAEIVDED